MSDELARADLDRAHLDSAVSAMLPDAGAIALRYFRTAINADDACSFQRAQLSEYTTRNAFF